MKVGQLPPPLLYRRLRNAGICWQTGPFTVRARTPLRDVGRELAFLYADYPLVEQDSLIDFDICIRPQGPLRRWVSVSVDGAVIYNWFRRHLALPLFEWALNQCVFQRPHQYLMLHSAVVERGGCAMIMPAPPGSGKSTLCAALVHRGWRLLSDEVALIQPWDGELIPVPRPVGLKESSIEVIRGFAPAALLGPCWPGTPKGRLAHMRAPLDAVDRARESARPRWLVFPKYCAGVPAQLTPLSKAQAFLCAAENAFNYSVLGRLGFETLGDFVDGCDCYEFTYSDLDEAVRTFHSLSTKQHASVAATCAC